MSATFDLLAPMFALEANDRYDIAAAASEFEYDNLMPVDLWHHQTRVSVLKPELQAPALGGQVGTLRPRLQPQRQFDLVKRDHIFDDVKVRRASFRNVIE